jgi:hypothetical protein
VTKILPLFPPVGTSAVTSVKDFTANAVTFTPPEVSAVVPVNSVPLIVRLLPTSPLVGVKLASCGVTRKATLLLSVAVGAVTSTGPVAASAATVAPIRPRRR